MENGRSQLNLETCELGSAGQCFCELSGKGATWGPVHRPPGGRSSLKTDAAECGSLTAFYSVGNQCLGSYVKWRLPFSVRNHCKCAGGRGAGRIWIWAVVGESQIPVVREEHLKNLRLPKKSLVWLFLFCFISAARPLRARGHVFLSCLRLFSLSEFWLWGEGKYPLARGSLIAGKPS